MKSRPWSEFRALLSNRDELRCPTNQFIGGIVGGEQPSRYSESPWLWNRLFTLLKLDAIFLAFDLDEVSLLGQASDRFFRVTGAFDLTVTNPFKTEILRQRDQIGKPTVVPDHVRRVGSANHLYSRSAHEPLEFDNTDGIGIAAYLMSVRHLRDVRVVLIGAGGAGRSIGFELVTICRELSIVDSQRQRAEQLVRDLSLSTNAGADTRVIGVSELEADCQTADLVISTASTGCPLSPMALRKSKDTTIFVDIRYGAEAALWRAATEAGCTSLDGRLMLFGQFAKAARSVVPYLGPSSQHVEAAIDMIRREYYDLHLVREEDSPGVGNLRKSR